MKILPVFLVSLAAFGLSGPAHAQSGAFSSSSTGGFGFSHDGSGNYVVGFPGGQTVNLSRTDVTGAFGGNPLSNQARVTLADGSWLLINAHGSIVPNGSFSGPHPSSGFDPGPGPSTGASGGGVPGSGGSSAVPEPGMALLFGAGLGGLMLARRRRRSAVTQI